MARLNYTVQEINAALAKAIAAANTGALADLNTTDKSSLVAAINESLSLAGLPSQTDNANKFLMTDGTSPSWENLGDSVSISGAIASFKRSRAGARLYPKIFFNPEQAGSGDPYPPGGGKNKFDVSARVLNQTNASGTSVTCYTLTNGVVTTSKTYGTNGRMFFSAMPMTAGTYTLSFDVSISGSGNINRSIRDMTNLTDIVAAAQVAPGHITVSFTLSADTNVAICIMPQNSTSGTASITNIQIETGSATSYAPYSNVRAISGWSQVNAWRGGKNLFNDKYSDWSRPVDYTVCPVILPAGQYTLSVRLKTGKSTISGWNAGFVSKGDRYANFENFNYISASTVNSASSHSASLTVTISQFSLDRHLCMYINSPYEATFNSIFDAYEIQLERNSTATAYEPYNGATYPISLGSTYYGGYLDLARGKIVATEVLKAYAIADMDNAENYPGWKNAGMVDIYGSGVQGKKQNMMGNIGTVFSINTNGQDILFLGTDDYGLTQSQWQAQHPNLTVQFIIPLSTPLEYDLASIPNITSLLGINNVFADSGDVEVTIPCDVASLDGNAKILPSQKTATIKEYSSAHTIDKNDYSCLLLVTGATTITLPACDIGTEIEIMRYGTSTVTIAPSGVTINGSSSNQTITTQYVSKKLKCVGATAWVMT